MSPLEIYQTSDGHFRLYYEDWRCGNDHTIELRKDGTVLRVVYGDDENETLSPINLFDALMAIFAQITTD